MIIWYLPPIKGTRKLNWKTAVSHLNSLLLRCWRCSALAPAFRWCWCGCHGGMVKQTLRGLTIVGAFNFQPIWKNSLQIGSFPHVGVKIKKHVETITQLRFKLGKRSCELSIIFLLKHSWGLGGEFLLKHPSCDFSVVLQGTQDPCPWSTKNGIFPGEKTHAAFKRRFLLAWWTQTFLKLPNYPNIYDVSRVSEGTYRSSSSSLRFFSTFGPVTCFILTSKTHIPEKTLWKFEGTRGVSTYTL